MAKAVAVNTETSNESRENADRLRNVRPEDALGGIFMLAIPEGTYVKLAEEAKKRGMPLATLVGESISEYLAKTAPGESPKRLLTEVK
jgi:hypothetical protein